MYIESNDDAIKYIEDMEKQLSEIAIHMYSYNGQDGEEDPGDRIENTMMQVKIALALLKKLLSDQMCPDYGKKWCTCDGDEYGLDVKGNCTKCGLPDKYDQKDFKQG